MLSALGPTLSRVADSADCWMAARTSSTAGGGVKSKQGECLRVSLVTHQVSVSSLPSPFHFSNMKCLLQVHQGSHDESSCVAG